MSFRTIKNRLLNYLLLYDPLCIPDASEGYHFLNPIDIICVEGAQKYCNIYCIGGVVFRSVSMSISQIEARLPDQVFFRVHRSYIVSRLHIRKMNKSKTRVYCLGDIVICIGETYQSELIKRFGV